MFRVDKPKAPFEPVFEVATTREDSEVALVHDPEAEPRILDQPPPHGHGLEADSCLWWRRGREPVSEVGGATSPWEARMESDFR